MPSAVTTPTSHLRSDAAGRSAQPASSPLPPPPAPAQEPGEPPRLDGRRVHIVDRALDYVALAASGLSAARIARKRRRSAGYVSILLRLGHAIKGLEPAELAALRSPRVTWKLAQRIVRTDADVGSIRHQLRLALGGFSTHNVDRRKHRMRRSPEPSARAGSAWGWDESWFTRDPLDYVRHHLAHLAALHRAVDARARKHASLHSARRLSVGQSLASLQRSLAAAAQPGGGGSGGAGGATPAELPASRALAALAVLEHHLAAAQAALAPLLDATAPASAPRPERRTGAPRRAADATPLASPLEIDQDLD